jgi:hypothetical protein
MSLFQVATREKAKARIALTGVSGAGKTLSALLLAYGLCGEWGKVAVIDTERERARFYADRTDLNIGKFLYAPLFAPYSPERYISYVKEAVEVVGGDGVVIIDSLSHAWNNEGGVLEIKDNITNKNGINSYTAWNEAGKVQNQLINFILSQNCHIICTMRSKMAYEITANEHGKMAPKKLGLAPIQRDDTEYEFDIIFNLARDHSVTISKDTTGLYKEQNSLGVNRPLPPLTVADGELLKAWLNEGVNPITCESCGKRIKNNRNLTANEIITRTKEHTGKILCLSCAKEWQANAKTVPNGDSEQDTAGVQTGV